MPDTNRQNNQSATSHDNAIITGLLSPQAYDHKTQDITLYETHISWILCTGQFAYKIKKPVNLGFLDFSTLDQRQHFCAEELRLNKTLAPELYLDVIPITETIEQPQVNGNGPIIEYAVKMIQFDNDLQFDRLLKSNRLKCEHIEALSNRIAAFHDSTEVSLIGDRGSPDSVHQPTQQNYQQASEHSKSISVKHRLRDLAVWHDAQFERLNDTLRQRKSAGFIRECHGDLHLANIALIANRVVIFDRLEFDQNLSCIDIISEIAFLLMDLEVNNRTDLADYFLRHWLVKSGDYAGLQLLPYYKVYRAMVRAKVALLSHNDGLFKSYLKLSESYTKTRPCSIIITHGLSGSGKSTITRLLAPAISAIVIRSDVERKRHFSGGNDLYSPATTDKTYMLIASFCRAVISAGYNAIIDATFLQASHRAVFFSLAKELDLPLIILDYHAPVAQLEQWLLERAQRNDDASDATIEILHQQLQTQESLTESEQAHAIRIDTSRDVDIEALATTIKERIPG